MWEKYSRTQLQNEEQSDPDIAKVYQWVSEKKRPEDDDVYLHKNQDGVRATEDVHFENLSKEESMKIWAERMKEEGKNRPQHPQPAATAGFFFYLLLRPLLNPAQSLRQLFLSISQLPPP